MMATQTTTQTATQTATMAVAVLTLMAGVAAGCGGSPRAPLTPEVLRGEAAHVKPQRVLALSASCGSVEFPCPDEYVKTVDEIVRSSMDFIGYALVQPDKLRKDQRERHETIVQETTAEQGQSESHRGGLLRRDLSTSSSSSSASSTRKSTVELSGSGFDDLTVPDQRLVLEQAGADSVLVVRIVVGAQHGVWSPNQSVEVMVKLAVDHGQTMAWSSRCIASSNDFSTVNAALENAARCAVHGGTQN